MTFRKTAVFLLLLGGGLQGADPASELFDAAKKGDKTKVASLLEKAVASIDAKDKNGRTPLMLSAQRHHAEIVRLLLAKGANPQVRDREGWTAIGLALFSSAGGMEETLRALPPLPKVRMAVAAKWVPDNLYSSCLVSPSLLGQHVAGIQPDVQVTAAFRDVASVSAKQIVEVSADERGDAILKLKVRPGASCVAQKGADSLSLAVDAELVRSRDEKVLHTKTYGGGLKGLHVRTASSPVQYTQLYAEWAKKHAESIYWDVLEAWLRATP